MMIGKFKKIILIVLGISHCFHIIAQRSIIMEKEGGVYKVPCTVNGTKMKFIFDTGASKVCISLSTAMFLYENGYLSNNDIVGKSKSTVADGSIVDNIDIILRDIEISGLHLKDVHALVTKTLSAPLLLGQTAIQQLGSITIEGNKLVINNVTKSLSEIEAEEIEKELETCMNIKDYRGAIKQITTLEQGWGLSAHHYRALLMSYYNENLYDDCINACERFLYDTKAEKSDIDYENVYVYMSHCHLKNRRYQDAIRYSNLGLRYCPKNNYENLSYLYYNLGKSYQEIKDKNNSCLNYERAINAIIEGKGYDLDEMIEGKVCNNFLNLILRSLGKIYMSHGDTINGSFLFVWGALCNDEDCIRYCKLYNINYKKEAKKLSSRNKKR